MPHPIITCTLEVLDQGERLLRDLPESAYTTVPTNAGSTIGQHIRHILDHYLSLMAGDQGVVDYDQRHRGSRIETDVTQARVQIADIITWARKLDEVSLVTPVTVVCEVSLCRTERAQVTSTLGRELMFLSSHMVHHQAIVAMIASALSVSVEPGLGLAPATRTYLRAVG